MLTHPTLPIGIPLVGSRGWPVTNQKKGNTMKEIGIEEVIKAYNPGPGRHWFDADTMRFFRTQLSGSAFEGPGGTYFVSSDKHPCRSGWCRRYSVRQFAGEGEIETLGEFGGYKNGAAAKRAAIKAAKGGAL